MQRLKEGTHRTLPQLCHNRSSHFWYTEHGIMCNTINSLPSSPFFLCLLLGGPTCCKPHTLPLHCLLQCHLWSQWCFRALVSLSDSVAAVKLCFCCLGWAFPAFFWVPDVNGLLRSSGSGFDSAYQSHPGQNHSHPADLSHPVWRYPSRLQD